MNEISRIHESSQQKLDTLKQNLENIYQDSPTFNKVCIYACGSLGRLEMVETSDLDLFFITPNPSEGNEPVVSVLDKYLFFSKLHEVNSNLGYPKPSKEGLYWEFISKENLLDIGSRQEDYNNSFTARMLLILESKPLYNEKFYNEIIEETVNKYFADYPDNPNGFYPLFLMNDILRYWYTLTLNYEHKRGNNRDANKRHWKHLKLKYARLVTCYSMLACLYHTNITPDFVLDCIAKTPFERLDMLARQDSSLQAVVDDIKKEYEWYLQLRTQKTDWWNDASHKTEAEKHADHFHDLVVHNFMKKVSANNQVLLKKTDIY